MSAIAMRGTSDPGALIEAARATLRRLSPVPGALFAFEVQARRNGSDVPITIGLTLERIDKLQELAALARAGHEVRVIAMGKKPVPGQPFLFEEMTSPVPEAASAIQPRPATPPSHASSTPGVPATVSPAPAAPQDPERGAAPSQPTADQGATLCVRADPAAEVGGSPSEAVTGLVAAPAPAGPAPDVPRPAGSPAAPPPAPASQGPTSSVSAAAGSQADLPEPAPRVRRSQAATAGARPVWYRRRVAELWLDLGALPREAVALHLLLSDLAFQRGSLPEDEVELRRVVGVGDELWRLWPDIRDLWPVSGLRRGRTRARMNVTLGEAFSEASEAVSNYRKRAKKGAAGRWKKGRADDASSNASSTRQAMPVREEEEEEKRKSREEKKGEGIEPSPEKQAIQERGQKGPPLEEVLGFARAEGLSEASARKYHGKRTETGWRGILDWRVGLRTWAAEDSSRAHRAPPVPSPQAVPDGSKYHSQKFSPKAFK